MADTNQIGKEIKLLAAMVYGESSAQNSADEMSALASVLVRQRTSRGYNTMEDFVNNEKTYSYVTSDGNLRYKKINAASDEEIRKDTGMSKAIAAAENALKGGVDLSNGAYFWDGADIKKNYKAHFKVRHGIRFSNPSHNIYDLKESTLVVIQTKTIIKRTKEKVTRTEVEIGRYEYLYMSTAGIGGTIFWRNSDGYLKTAGAKEYK